MTDQPMPLDSMSFRQTMGLFATGVTVLWTHTESGEPIGMTANALTSVSLDPLLLLVCVAKDANIADHLLKETIFSLSILCEEQAVLSDYFAGIYSGSTPPEFSFDEWSGGLRIEGAAGAVGCRRTSVLDGGDHWIIM